jgi:hypothetical protein
LPEGGQFSAAVDTRPRFTDLMPRLARGSDRDLVAQALARGLVRCFRWSSAGGTVLCAKPTTAWRRS